MNPTGNALSLVAMAVQDGTDWLAAMLDIDTLEPGAKRFAKMHIALLAATKRSGAGLLAEFFAGRPREQIASFIKDVAARLTGADVALPAWSTLSLPGDRP